MFQIINNFSNKPFVKTFIIIFLISLIFFFNFKNDDIKKLSVKSQFVKLKEPIKPIKIMIEIGVQSGVFANEVLSKWPSFEQYFGIDLWAEQKNYVDHANIKQEEQDQKYLSTFNLLTNKYGSDKIKLIRNYSTNAVVLFHDESIDFIYVDARHDYCGVYEDLNNYYPKLKCNGMMAGHDYHTVDEVAKVSGQDFGLCQNGERNLKNGGAVKGAVIQFMKEKNIQNLITTNEGFWISYYFLKSC